jgi:hypothetical protein
MKKILALVGLITFGVVVYWATQPPKAFALVPVRNVVQRSGSLSVVDVPVSVDSKAFLRHKLIDLEGKTVYESPIEPFIEGTQYKVLTDSRLEPGEYNVILWVSYRLNPISWKQQEFVLAVLNVR